MTTQLPGLAADWLNGWLAAVGITVLLPERRLGWSAGPSPVAVVDAEPRELAGDLMAALPNSEALRRLVIARTRADAESELPRNVTKEQFRDRAALARANPNLVDVSLEKTLTDLGAKDVTTHSPFDPPMQKGITLWERATATRGAMEDWDLDSVVRSLNGTGRRAQLNGLGFDVRRFVSGAQPAGKVSVDPLVELLAFFGCDLFPIRGNGRADRTRGWDGPSVRRHSFRWPVWEPMLDRWAIDALLDRVYQRRPLTMDRQLRLLGVTGLFGSVPTRPRGSKDVSCGYASERLA